MQELRRLGDIRTRKLKALNEEEYEIAAEVYRHRSTCMYRNMHLRTYVYTCSSRMKNTVSSVLFQIFNSNTGLHGRCEDGENEDSRHGVSVRTRARVKAKANSHYAHIAF